MFLFYLQNSFLAVILLSYNILSLKLGLGSTKFSKYQGLGNDFILIDNTDSTNPYLSPEEGVKVCDRNFGIGADGVIFVLPGLNGCDYTMRIYNSDGSEPQMCGNGIRCMAKYLLSEIEEKSDLNNEVSYDIWTGAGKIVPKLKNGEITVDMGEPVLVPDKIPTLIKPNKDGKVIDAEFNVANSNYKVTTVSMGNPHVTIYFDDLDSGMDIPFNTLGPLVEKHPLFPQKINAHFVQVLSRTHLRVKTWERGAGATLACGTGACSVVVSGVLSGRSETDCERVL